LAVEVARKKRRCGSQEEEVGWPGGRDIYSSEGEKKGRTSKEHSEDSLQSEAREEVCTCCWRFAVGVKEKKLGASSGRGNYIIT
jgi:hypothetical protein